MKLLNIARFVILALFVLAQSLTAQSSKEAPNPNQISNERKQEIVKQLKESSNKIWMEENRGQMPSTIQYGFATNFGALFVEHDKLRLVARKERSESVLEANGFKSDEKVGNLELHTVEITFPGGNSHLNVVPLKEQQTQVNYFKGNDPSKWLSNVRVYGELLLKDVYPGVDLRLYSDESGSVEFDWVIQNAEDYSKIRMKCKGQDNIKLNNDGSFDLGLRMTNITFKVPRSYQYINGAVHPVSARYRTVGNDELVFNVFGIEDKSAPLVIDPTLLWGTWFDANNTGFDAYSYAVELDSCGNAIIANTTNISVTTTASYMSSSTGYDNSYSGTVGALVYKMNSVGTTILAYTYIGDNDILTDVEIFPNGRILVAGYHGTSGLASFPTTVAGTSAKGNTTTAAYLNTTSCATCYGVLVVLTSDLSDVLYGTLLPGKVAAATLPIAGPSNTDLGATSLQISSNTAYYVAGITNITAGSLVPGSGVPDAALSGNEGYIARFSGTGYNTRDWATYVGGTGNEQFIGIALDLDKQNLAFAGYSTSSAGWPGTVSATDNTFVGASEAFVGVLPNQSTTPTTFSMLSWLGGDDDEGTPVIVCDSTYIYVLGMTQSTNLPGISTTTGAASYQTTKNNGNGNYDMFIARVPIAGGTTNFVSTYLGGSNEEYSGGLVYNNQDYNLWFFSTTASNGTGTNVFPTVNTTPGSNYFDNTHAGNRDIAMGAVSTNCQKLIYSTFIGGPEDDYLGNTGDLKGTGHYSFSKKSNTYALTSTVHSDISGSGANTLIAAPTFDATRTPATGTTVDAQFLIKMNLASLDLGDAPTVYEKGTPAKHSFNPRLTTSVVRLGLLEDADGSNQPNATATGDDINVTSSDPCSSAGDDEDGVASFPVLNAEDPALGVTTYTVAVSVFNNTGSAQTLMGWIDFDDSGTFSAPERATVSVPSSASQQSVNLVWTVSGRSCPVSIVGGRTYARLRIGTTANFPADVASTWADERALGTMNDGEVEDYYVNIRGRDYGDLPLTGSPAYSASSILRTGDFNDDQVPDDAGAVWAGTKVDIEKNCASLGNATATADDNDQIDDEDGLVFPGVGLKRATSYNFTVNASGTTSGGTAYYGLWFDFNGDGDFTDPKDAFYSGSITLSTGATGPFTGSAVISVLTPPGVGQFTRTGMGTRLVIRNTSAPSSSDYFTNYSTAFNGEVEDYVGDYAVVISGNVFNDQDGTNDNQVDGPGINQPGGSTNQLWAYAINTSGLIVDSIMVTSTGSFDLLNVVAGNVYTVKISTTRLAIGANGSTLTASLPAGWYAVSEKYGLNDAVSGNNNQIESGYSTANMSISTSLGTLLGVTNVNFGIDQEPTSNNVSSPSQVNPGSTTQVTAPTLTGTDPEDGTMGAGKRFRITSLDANANIYYNGNLLSSGSLPYTFFSYSPTALKVDPIPTGAVTIVFNYVWVDSAGVPDATSNTITLPFTDPSVTISGTVYDDGNGTINGVIDGTPFNKPSGTQLYAYLINSSNVVLDSQYILTNGTYSLTAQGSTSGLQVKLTTVQYAIGATVAANSLPTDWVNVGDAFGTNNGAGSGIQGTTTTADGLVPVTTGTTNITGLDFGLDMRPSSNNATASTQVNPGGTVKVQVPSLTGTDTEDGSLPATLSKTFIVTSIPGNANLYYNGSTTPVVLNQVIANYDPTKLLVDPTFNGAGTVIFTFAWRDSAHLSDLSPATVTMPFGDITISGTVFDDGNGTLNGAIDGTAFAKPSGVQLYAYLIDGSTNLVVDSEYVHTNGTYSFSGVSVTTNYSVRVTQTQVGIGAGTPTLVLPTDWVYVGDAYGTNNSLGSGIEGATGSADGAVSLTTTTSAVTNLNFGLDMRPSSNNATAGSQVNPGGTVKVQVPSLTGTDTEDGSLPATLSKTFIVTSIPGNANLYYNGSTTPVVLNQVIANYDPTKLLVDPTFNGAGTVIFTFAWRDSAHLSDLSPATVTMPFGDITISGTVFDDGNGTLNGAIDGTAFAKPSGVQLYAYLIDGSTNLVVDSEYVHTNGTYSFSGVSVTTNYSVRVTQTQVGIGAGTPTLVLPTDWVYVGDAYGTNNSLGSGIEGATGSADGAVSLTTTTSAVTNLNFGLDMRPSSNNATAGSQVNPGGTVKVQVPSLTGTDTEDGSLPATLSKTFIVTSIPGNANLYYNGSTTPVVLNQVIANYDPTKLLVDPTFNGAGTVTFTFAWRDSAHLSDLTPATVTMPFTDLNVSGTLFHDGNGLRNSLIDGTGTGVVETSTVFAYLVNAGGIVVDKQTLNVSNGTYTLVNADANSAYTVRLSTSSVAIGVSAPTNFSLPGTWVATGEQYGTGNNAGSGIESGTPNGQISVTTTTSNITNVNFGVEYTPFAHDKTYQLHPDSIINNLTGLGTYTHFIPLNASSGSNDTTVNTSYPNMPGKLSGFDLEDGRLKGVNGGLKDTTVFVTLPDPTYSILVYKSGSTVYQLIPNPTISDPSRIFWNVQFSRYQIPALNPANLLMYVKLAYQTGMSFQYAYKDSALLLGRIATYTINSIALPLSVSDLNCQNNFGHINLNWTLYDAQDVQNLEILRSSDGVKFNVIGKITEIDRVAPSKEYHFTDISPIEGNNFYKVKVTTNNGTSLYTNVCNNGKNQNIALNTLNIIPNPTNNNAFITFNVTEAFDINLQIFDNLGNQIQVRNISLKEGTSQVSLESQDFIPGVYNVRVMWDNQVKVLRLVKL